MGAGRWLAAALLALPGVGAAQEIGDPDLGVEAQAQIGIQLFPGAAGDIVGNGLAYGVAIGVEPWWLLGFEASYQGANYSTVQDLDGPNVSIFENGGQLAVELSPRFRDLEPHVLAGVGLSDLEVVEENVRRTDLQDDMLVKLPLAVGLDVHLLEDEDSPAHLLVGARGTYSFVFDNEFVAVSPRGADQLTLALLLGGQF